MKRFITTRAIIIIRIKTDKIGSKLNGLRISVEERWTKKIDSCFFKNFFLFILHLGIFFLSTSSLVANGEQIINIVRFR